MILPVKVKKSQDSILTDSDRNHQMCNLSNLLDKEKADQFEPNYWTLKIAPDEHSRPSNQVITQKQNNFSVMPVHQVKGGIGGQSILVLDTFGNQNR